MNTTPLKTLLVGALALFVSSPLRVQAQNYSIEWFKISGGGGASSGGQFSISGTIGQADAGKMSGGSLPKAAYALAGGFWSAIMLVQTEEAPRLSLALDPSLTSATISWPMAATPFVLEESPTLPNSASWSLVSLARQTNATSILVRVPIVPGNRFYRLSKP